jgi:hypothetical protein
MPRRKVSLFGVNFDSLVMTATSFAFFQSVALPDARGAARHSITQKQASGRGFRIVGCEGGLSIGGVMSSSYR